MTHDCVGVFGGVNAVVSTKFIGDDKATLSHVFLDDRNEGASTCVSHLAHINEGMSLLLNFTRLKVYGFILSNHRHTEDRLFNLDGAVLSLRSLLGFVLVGFPTTKVHFIALNSTPQAHHIMLCIKGANLMKDEPSSFLCNRNVGSQLNRRDTLLVGGDKVHSHKPLGKANLSIFKDSTHEDGEVRLAMSTMVASIGA